MRAVSWISRYITPRFNLSTRGHLAVYIAVLAPLNDLLNSALVVQEFAVGLAKTAKASPLEKVPNPPGCLPCVLARFGHTTPLLLVMVLQCRILFIVFDTTGDDEISIEELTSFVHTSKEDVAATTAFTEEVQRVSCVGAGRQYSCSFTDSHALTAMCVLPRNCADHQTA